MEFFLLVGTVSLFVWVYQTTGRLRDGLRAAEGRLNFLEHRIIEFQEGVEVESAEPIAPASPAAQASPPQPPREPGALPAVTPPVAKPLYFEPVTVPQPARRVAPPRAPSAPPIAAPVHAASTASQRARRLFDLEETLGTNWLLKIGMAILVVGISLFLGYSMQRMGPSGKVAVGIGTSVAAIIGGKIMERHRRYETFGQVLLSGGWGLAYFTAYAMRHIEASRVLESDGAGIFVMLAVAAGMVAQSLTYQSQFVTGFAYGLAYLTLAIHPADLNTLLAGLMLSASVVFILQKLRWFALESFIIAGTYLGHFRWLYGIIAPMGGEKKPFPEYTWSFVLLSSYWALFTTSHFLRRGRNDSEERMLELALILNGAGYIAISGYQSVHPELAFGFFLVLGLVYFGVAYLDRILGRRAGYLVASTIGAILLVTAIPYKFSGNDLALVWLAECEVFLIGGYRLHEIHFRRLGWLASALFSAYLFFSKIVPAVAEGGAPSAHDGATLAVTALAFVLGALTLGRKYPAEAAATLEKSSLTAHIYVGWSFAIAAAWFLTPARWLALVWIGLGFLLFEAHLLLRETHLRRLAHASAFAGFIRAVAADLPFQLDFPGLTWGAGILIAAGFSLYLFSQNYRRTRSEHDRFLFINHAYMGWGLLIGTSWIVLPRLWWGVALGLGALLLHSSGLALGELSHRIQAQATALIAAAHTIVVNVPTLDALGWAGWTCGAAALIVYGYGEMARRHPLSSGKDGEWQRCLNAPAATLILTLAAWYALSVASVAIAWALLALALIEIGRRTDRPDFRYQGHLVAAVVLVRIVIANLNLTTQFGPVSARLVTVLPLLALFYYLFAELGRDKAGGRLTVAESSARIPAIYSYFGLIALLGLLRFEVASSWVVAAWAAVAAALMGFSRLRSLAAFRPQAILVTKLALVRCAFENLFIAGDLGWLTERAATVGTVAAAFLVGYGFARSAVFTEPPTTKATHRGTIRHIFDTCVDSSYHFFFFAAAALVTVLIWVETAGRGYLTAAWALEGLVVFTFAVFAHERAYRVFGLMLLLVCTAKIVCLDVWRLETLQRILAFIVLGTALVLVSFFYTRYQDSWRKALLG